MVVPVHIYCKKVYVNLTIFWSPQLHSFCVCDTYDSRIAYNLKEFSHLSCIPFVCVTRTVQGLLAI